MMILEEEEKQKPCMNLQDSHATDLPEKNIREPSDFRSLSSVQSSIKRSRTNCQRREKRQPNIIVEPWARNSWSSGGSVVSPHRSGWSSGIQTASQVIKEKTQEASVVKPIAAPRQSIVKSSTQTEAVTHCGETSPPAERSKKPQKPPRVPKSPERKLPSERQVKIGTKTAFTITEDQSDFESDIKRLEKANSRSVTVHWNIPLNPPPVSAENTTANLENDHQPTPHPRTKLNKFALEEEAKVQSLVKLGENLDTFQFDSQELPTTNSLREFLEVFSGGGDFEEGSYIVKQSDKKLQDKDADGKMNNNHNQQNFRARIQAFESQDGEEEGDASQSDTPNLPPRRTTYKPPVSAKPSASFRQQSLDDANQNVSTTQNFQNPFTGSRPQPPTKPARQSIRNQLEALHSKGYVPQRSSPPGQSSSDSFEEEPSMMPPIPPMKSFKEPLKPNLNINNQNSASMFTDNDRVESVFNNFPVKPQFNADGGGVSINRPSIAKRPTTIRVPSKTGSMLDNFQDRAPPIPIQNPIGSLNSSGSYTQSVKSSMSLQNSFSIGPEPSLPPRNATMKKSLPPRPPPAKAGSGRPLPPNHQASGRSQSAPLKHQAQMPSKKGLILPPRPNPGHCLYNKYTLQLPHGIASFDYDGSDLGELSLQKNEVLLLVEEINRDEFECQVGGVKGRVHTSRMKIITPLDSSSLQGATGGDGCGLKVQALYDFNPEDPAELSLREGDVVTEVEQVDNQWYKGSCNGSTGYFPVNYVKVLSNSPKLLPKRKTKPKAETISGPRCVARFDFVGEHSDELSFSEGDTIQLKEYKGEDWARGQIGISVGIFPLNYVDIIEDLPPPPSQQQSSRVALPGMAASPSMQSEAAKPVQAPKPRVEWATALYDYAAKSGDELSFQQGDRILITKHINGDWSSGRLNGREGMFPRAFIEDNTGQTFKNQQNGAAGGGRARALYSYSSDCDEELSLKLGDMITNLESVDDEWFLGDLRGKRALVPKNYVQVLK